jgi:hypothetical protein
MAGRGTAAVVLHWCQEQMVSWGPSGVVALGQSRGDRGIFGIRWDGLLGGSPHAKRSESVEGAPMSALAQVNGPGIPERGEGQVSIQTDKFIALRLTH